MKKEIDDIFKEVIRSLKLESLSPENQEEIISGLGQGILEEVMVTSLEKLSPEDREKLLELENKGDAGEVYQFLESHIPDFQNFAREIAQKMVMDFMKAVNG